MDASEQKSSLERQDSFSCSMSDTSGNGKAFPVFFKFKQRVKKALFVVGGDLDDLKALFLSVFSDVGCPKEKLPPFYITDRHSRVPYELDDKADLYPNCVLECKWHEPKEIKLRRQVGVGYNCFQDDKLVIVMVGLPATGKTYIARKIARYVKWIGIGTEVFNVGNYRRKKLGPRQPNTFFDPCNEEGVHLRLEVAMTALDDMMDWLNKGGRVAIYDATNSTLERRKLIYDRCQANRVDVMFVESLCDDQAVIENNIKENTQYSPDYKEVTPEEAIADFNERIAQYKKCYRMIDEITEQHLSYVKLYDVGKKVVVNRIQAYLPSRIVFFLMNLHITHRHIWLTRHGESEFNKEDRIGGDSPLTSLGLEYAEKLGDWVKTTYQPIINAGGSNLTIWTSTLKRAVQTANQIVLDPPAKVINLRALDEIDAGMCDSMTYDEIAEQMPDEYAARAADKLRYRYPQGESYEDLIQRLEPIIFELERQRNSVLIISHQATLRALFAYFMAKDAEETPFLNVPKHTVVQLTPKAYGTEQQLLKLM